MNLDDMYDYFRRGKSSVQQMANEVYKMFTLDHKKLKEVPGEERKRWKLDGLRQKIIKHREKRDEQLSPTGDMGRLESAKPWNGVYKWVSTVAKDLGMVRQT
ncbi:uncharacterized protein LOC106670750 [Cimex lectularius]|uniref:Uncharacterized protein n=1 Tax=Cimex lectularius TaxID=79782 RepID=A0A8I6S280_CIMLE|nr:uncharacterized protein LOC106670750 [Cimex lectularius]